MSGFEQLKIKMRAKVLSRFPSLSNKAADKIEPLAFDSIPWAAFNKPLSEAKISMVTTAGVHLKSDEPFDMVDTSGDPTFRIVPTDASRETMMITHNYYDHTDADRDINIVFPVDRLKELANEGVIGSVSDRLFSFMGHIEPNHFDSFLNDNVLQVAKKIKEDNVDAVLVTPG